MYEDSGQVEPFRGEYETKDGVLRCRDQQMNGVGGRICAKNEGLCTAKSKHDIPKDVWGQAGREGVGQDKEVARAMTNTNTDVEMEVRSTVRWHREQGRNDEFVMWPHQDLGMSAYLEVHIDAQVEPSEGNCVGRLRRPSRQRAERAERTEVVDKPGGKGPNKVWDRSA